MEKEKSKDCPETLREFCRHFSREIDRVKYIALLSMACNAMMLGAMIMMIGRG